MSNFGTVENIHKIVMNIPNRSLLAEYWILNGYYTTDRPEDFQHFYLLQRCVSAQDAMMLKKNKKYNT